jgi:cation:H+ antiporter
VSSLSGEGDIALGNIVGSNSFNVLFILGVSALIYPLRVHRNTIWKEIPLSLLAGLVLWALVSDHILDGSANPGLTRAEGIALLGFFAIFLYYTFIVARSAPAEELHNKVKTYPIYVAILMVLGGLGLLVFGGRWMVDGAVQIAEALGMSKSAIGLTIVAAGTSVPELATSAVAAFKRNSDIAIGNVVGSNIFNIFFILGTSAVVHPLGLGNISMLDLGVVVFSSMLLFVKSYDSKISRLEGGILISIYVVYVAYLLMNS